jgi:hypothetical protein
MSVDIIRLRLCNHFPSKEALAAEACCCTFEQKEAALVVTLERMAKEGAPGGALAQFMSAFLSPEHRDDATGGVPAPRWSPMPGGRGRRCRPPSRAGWRATFLHSVAAALVA